MTPYQKYMIFYTSLQVVGTYGIIKLVEWEKKQRENK